MYSHFMFVGIPLFLLLSLPSSANPGTPALTAADAPSQNFAAITKQAAQARESDRLNDALHLYSDAVRLRPSWADGWWWQGSILYDQDRFAEAQAPLKRFIALSAKPAPAYAFLALCEYETQDYDAALQHFSLWSQGGSPGTDALLDVAGYHWALLLTRQGRFNEALFLLAAKGRKLGPVPTLTEATGLAALRMAFLPENYPQEKREEVWLAGLEVIYSTLGQYQRSDDCATELMRHYGGEQSVHYIRGTLLGFQKQWESAAAEFEDELKITPDDVASLVELAVARVENLQPNDALAPARRAVTLDAENARAHYILGRALFDTGSYAESVPELEIAKRLAPQSARVRFVLSGAYRHVGRVPEAKREENAFLALKDKEEVLAPLEEKLRTSAKPDSLQ
jgi:tetratricopeptide (TPR) repeat protein